MTTTDVEALHAALDADPANHGLRMVLADALDDAGSPLAAGYRALALTPGTTLYPIKPSVTVPGVSAWWTWFPDPPGTGKRKRVLPRDWFAELAGGRCLCSNGCPVVGYGADPPWWDYTSRREAEDAAAEAFTRLPPERQRELLGDYAG